MRIGFGIKFFYTVASAILASATLLSCSDLPGLGAPVSAPPQQQQQPQLDALPPAFREVLGAEPEKDQQAFLARSANEQHAIIEEWERREKMLDRFTSAERTIISTLSQEDTDDFFQIPEDHKDQQEQYLADAETRYLDSLDDCLVNTHRRFGPRVESNIAQEALKRFTPPEQAIIKHLTPEESKQFLTLSQDQREQFLTDTADRKVDQLLSCVTHSNRRLGEPL